MSGSESTKDHSYQVPEKSRPSLTNHRNLAYNILKYLEDEMVRDKEISDLGPCSECTNDILTLPLKAYTVLSCGHLFHRLCIEKKLMITRPDVCPFHDCGKKVDAIYPVPTSTRRDSQSSQSSGTSALSTFMGEKFNLISPIPEDPMEEVEDTSNQETEKRLFCAKCSEEITVDFPKDTVFLSCKHAVHYDCIDNPHKRCPTCTSADDVEMISVEQTSSTAQKRSNDLPEKSSSKKQKTSNKEGVSSMLKKLIEELLTDNPNNERQAERDLGQSNATDASLSSGNFFHLSSMIDQAEEKNKDATQNVINRYFDFGEALHLRYKELKPNNGKYGAEALVKEEVRKQISVTELSDEALRKRLERAEKVYKLFNGIGKSKIARIRTFPARFILNLSDINVYHVIAGVLAKANQ